jgi:acyl-CoA thioesterase-1
MEADMAIRWTCVLLTLLAAAPATRPADAPVDPAGYGHPVRVACVGDSITAGAGTSQGRPTSWDGVLGRMLDRRWTVENFGSSGKTLLKHGDHPYQTEGAMKKALASRPDVVVVMLGTNDSKPQNWVKHEQFAADFKDLVDQFKALPNHPRVFLCTPPFVTGANRYRIDEGNVQAELPLLRQLADDEQAGLIDVHAATVGSAGDFPDTVHPNDAGAVVIARVVYAALTGRAYAGDPPPRANPATRP